MKINHIDLGEHPILLAPMEDVTDPAFRLMCKKFGADMVYTEFVSSDALIRAVNKTAQKLSISDEERPVAIQIYGKDTETMVEAAKIVEQAQPDILDINFGCPVKRVAGKGAGAGMLQNIPKMLEITRAVVEAVKIPVTVKTRLGWDANNKIIVDSNCQVLLKWYDHRGCIIFITINHCTLLLRINDPVFTDTRLCIQCTFFIVVHSTAGR